MTNKKKRREYLGRKSVHWNEVLTWHFNYLFDSWIATTLNEANVISFWTKFLYFDIIYSKFILIDIILFYIIYFLLLISVVISVETNKLFKIC